MEILFWVACACILYAYFGYPFVLWIASRRPVAAVEPFVAWPRVSIIITAHNEAAQLADKLDNTRALDYPGEPLEIIVASDGSTDDTVAIAQSYAARGIRVIQTRERRGKEAAQREALALAHGEVIVFTDSGTRMQPQAIQAIVHPFADSTVGCVTSVDCHQSAGPAGGEGWYLRYEMLLRGLESRFGSVIGLSGSLFAVRRQVCQQWSDRMPSDFHLLLQCIRSGLRGVTAPGAVGFYEPVHAEKKEFGRKVRTILRGMTTLWDSRDLLNPFRYPRFAWQLWSHKVCRWAVPLWLLAAFLAAGVLAAGGSIFYTVVLAGQAVFYGLALLGHVFGLRTLLARAPFWFCLFNLSILKAWVLFVCGSRIVRWDPTRRETAPSDPAAFDGRPINNKKAYNK